MSDAPPYLVAVCEGDHCVPLVACADHDQQDGDLEAASARLVETLPVIASLLRTSGALWRLVLLNGETGEILAMRPVWP